MAYIDRSSNTRRTGTAVAVAVIQAGVIYAVVTGLAVKFVDPPPKDEALQSTQFRTEPIPQPIPPEPQIKDHKTQPDPTPRPSSASSDTIPTGPTVAQGGAGAELDGGSGGDVFVYDPPKPPPPTFTPRLAKPLNSPGGWATTNDYPARDLREGNQGVTRFRLSIGADGNVLGCEIVGSSGFAGLDRTTCDKVSRRARFEPAMDGYGNKVAGTYTSNVRWQIPD